jgi:hypothetical protein
MARHPHDHETRTGPEREVIVTDGGRRGGGIGAVIAAVIGAIVVLLLAWLLFFGGGDGDAELEAPSVDVPEDVNVDIDEGGGDAEG